MIQFANAKINIGLQITDRRANGYHDIESIFYPIPINDIIEIHESQQYHIKLTGTNLTLDANNSCTRAYEIIKRNFSIPPVTIHLHKIIPIGAGLGGGSSDSVAVLKGLNELFNLSISNDQLSLYASSIGSDCSFFIENAPAFVSGVGDIIERLDLSLKGKYLFIHYPNLFISTKEAYDLVKPKKSSFDLSKIKNSPIPEWRDHVKNDFEDSLFKQYPQLKSIKKSLYQLGAVYASLSGSGSTVYGIFEEPPNRKQLELINGTKFYIKL